MGSNRRRLSGILHISPPTPLQTDSATLRSTCVHVFYGTKTEPNVDTWPEQIWPFAWLAVITMINNALILHTSTVAGFVYFLEYSTSLLLDDEISLQLFNDSH